MEDRTCKLPGCDEPIAPYKKSPLGPRGGKCPPAVYAHIMEMSAKHRAKPRYCLRHHQMDLRLRSGYKITLPEYIAMYRKQRGRCKICKAKKETQASILIRRRTNQDCLVVDHNHDTGKIRGLICIKCNIGIGNLKDDVKLLRAAIAYLEENDG